MESPPLYEELGQTAEELLTLGFGIGLCRISVKTKSQNGVMEVKTQGESRLDSAITLGSLETLYRWTSRGVSLTERWTTDSSLGTCVTVDNAVLEGLSLSLDTIFSPNTGKKSASGRAVLRRPNATLSLLIEKSSSAVGPTSTVGTASAVGPSSAVGTASAMGLVLGSGPWIAGVQVNLDPSRISHQGMSVPSQILSNASFTAGYREMESQTLLTLQGHCLTASLSRRIGEHLLLAAIFGWRRGGGGGGERGGGERGGEGGLTAGHGHYGSNPTVSIAGKVTLHPSASVSVRFSSLGLLALSYCQDLCPGVGVTLSVQLDASSGAKHGVGIGLEMEP